MLHGGKVVSWWLAENGTMGHLNSSGTQQHKLGALVCPQDCNLDNASERFTVIYHCT